MCVWNRCFHSSSSTIVEAVGVVEVEAKRVDVLGSNSTKVLLDKSNANNFAKNFFRALHLSYHAMLNCDKHTIS